MLQLNNLILSNNQVVCELNANFRKVYNYTWEKHIY